MSLGDVTFRNTVTVVSANIITKVLDIGTTLILVRLLEPAVFGLLAITSIIVNILLLFRDFGVESALIYRKGDISEAADTAFFMIPLIALLLYSAAFFSADFIAEFYGEGIISPVIRVSALSIIVYSLGSVPLTLLAKELDFYRKVLPEITSAIVKVFITLFLAFNGFGIWSIVYGGLVSGIIGLITVWIVSDWRPTFQFNKRISWELIGYGKHIFGLVVLVFILTNIDDVAVGKILGVTLLGYYSIAYSTANLPVTNITHVVSKVMFPTYSRIQDNMKKLKTAYTKTIEYVSVISIPATLGIFTLAPEIVVFVLGNKWDPAIMVTPLRILSVYALFRSLAITGDVFRAIGRPKFLVDVTVVQLILVLIFIIPAISRYGLNGISVLTTMGVLLSLIVCTGEVMKVLDLGWIEFAELLKNKFTASFSAMIVIGLLKNYLVQSAAVFIFYVLIYCLIYLSVLYHTDRKTVLEMIRLVKEFLEKK
jgi:O-antigen/teichoic acid export membrane protein